MKLKQIEVTNLRIIDKVSLSFDQLNIIYGKNGQGKTSLLESIFLLAFTKSHKTNHEKEVIQTESDFAKVFSKVELDGMDHKHQIVLTNTGKKVSIDQDDVPKLADYIGQINVVLFAPDDLRLVKGEPALKRKFFDLELGQVDPVYIQDLLLYRALLKQRNEHLKKLGDREVSDDIYLDVLTEQLVGYANKIQSARKIFLDQLNVFLKPIHKEITNGKELIELEYLPKPKQSLAEEMKKRNQLDILRGSTSLGPHRDEFLINVNGQDLAVFGSQGQQRTAVLSIKLALIEFVKKHKGEHPILLLDDVFSELDEERLHNLLHYISPEIQTFITTTEINHIDQSLKDRAKLFEVEQGLFKEGE